MGNVEGRIHRVGAWGTILIVVMLVIVPMSASFSPPPAALPSEHELVLKVIPMPGDCNANGDIFGGWVMAQVDLAGSVLPARYVQGPHGHRGGQ